MDALFGFLLASFALTGSPGPATLSMAATGAAFGVRRGLGYMVGIVLGMIAVMCLTATGVVGLVLAVPGATSALAVLAAAYFVYLAFRIATAPPLSDADQPRRPPSVAGGLFLSLVNPKAYAAMAAIFSSFVLIGDHLALDAVTKIAILVVIITTVNSAWLVSGAALTRIFRNPTTNRAINIAFAVLLLISVAIVLHL